MQTNELNAAQLRMVLEVIAGRASVLWDLLAELETRPGLDHDVATAISCAAFAVETIGALADDAVGGQVCGSARYWHYGPLFESLAPTAPPGA